MPKTNPGRTTTAEIVLAQRICYERERRHWSWDHLMKTMDKVGCHIPLSALYRIAENDIQRRITVDELVGFAAAFGVSLDEMLGPIKDLHRPVAQTTIFCGACGSLWPCADA